MASGTPSPAPRGSLLRGKLTVTREEYISDGQCCKKCKRGFVKNIKCPTDTTEHCVSCKNGKEYVDHVNDLDECFRCSSCDITFGLEVANCTPDQNTECICGKSHFCNSSVPCRHCYPCTICESGVIEKQCTSTSDTVCGMKGMRRQKGRASKENPGDLVLKPEGFLFQENVPLMYTDVDLSSHIAGIVEEMTLQEVQDIWFVITNYQNLSIDQTVRDYFNDTSEQKIKLFQACIKDMGIKGAYGTLICQPERLKMCAVADKIEEKLKATVSSSQDGGLSYSDDTEQSKTCTQESRNSYNDSAELSKTCSGTLEET
ncbi:LOW QUALITY PROTEIN: tumor necrosis factor receptor superfamily member 6 [Pluvialis apricaria]